MKDVMGLIKLTEKDEYISQLTYDRTVAAIPFGGRYRLIDFVLSNMVNAGIRNVGVLTQKKYRSLMEHLRLGKEWDLHRKRDGLFMLPPDNNGCSAGSFGDCNMLKTHLDYLNKSEQKYVIITSSNVICNLDFQKAVAYHKATEADVTVIYSEEQVLPKSMFLCTGLEIDEDNRITKIGTEESKNISLEMYIMSKNLLIEIIGKCTTAEQYNLINNYLEDNINRLKILGYIHEGYTARINTTADYFYHSMELLKPPVWEELFYRHGLIYTKMKDEAPTKYSETAQVYNSLLASGCQIEGKVENSILFRDVKVERGAHVKDSIILPKVKIESGAQVENVILDKEAIITADKLLQGERKSPIVIKRKIRI